MAKYKLFNADCLDVMPRLTADSIDSIVTDPPYGYKFMGKDWDHGVPGQHFWEEALRVAKPGAYLLAFGGTRTYHRLACAIEDAGWEIRDCVMWVYGSGFPKSHDVSKAIDKAAGAQRGRKTVRSKSVSTCYAQDDWTRQHGGTRLDAEAITDAASQWQGWGTALKPAWEPIIVARKPLCGTVAENVLKHGTGGINVDGCRVGTESTVRARGDSVTSAGWASVNRSPVGGSESGRWPANLIHDGSEEVVELFPNTTSGKLTPQHTDRGKEAGTFGAYSGREINQDFGGDSGSAARFFYCAKANKKERGEGNNHPTVKPLALIEYLVRLVTQPGGTCLDIFMGSGTTGIACARTGMKFVGIDDDTEHGYLKIALKRIREAYQEKVNA